MPMQHAAFLKGWKKEDDYREKFNIFFLSSLKTKFVSARLKRIYKVAIFALEQNFE